LDITITMVDSTTHPEERVGELNQRRFRWLRIPLFVQCVDGVLI
jgi:hypothetical protein